MRAFRNSQTDRETDADTLEAQPDDRPITALTHPHHVFTHCEFCSREVPLTFHHLLPVKTHRRTRFQRRYSKYELKNRGLYLCRPCHDGIHDIIPDEVVLGEQYNTKEQLLAHEGIARHVAWVAKQK